MRAFPFAMAVIGGALATFVACAPFPPPPPPPPPPGPPGPARTVCVEPRPQVCTQVYQPVCATRRDGSARTYGNSCQACGDGAVISHRPGPC